MIFLRPLLGHQNEMPTTRTLYCHVPLFKKVGRKLGGAGRWVKNSTFSAPKTRIRCTRSSLAHAQNMRSSLVLVVGISSLNTQNSAQQHSTINCHKTSFKYKALTTVLVVQHKLNFLLGIRTRAIGILLPHAGYCFLQ